jgi:hypothetical protein
MKKILAYSLSLMFVAALVAPTVSFADEEFPANAGQRAAEGSDPKEDATDGSGAVAMGIRCDACDAHTTAGNIHTQAKNQFKKGSTGSANSTDTKAVEGDR